MSHFRELMEGEFGAVRASSLSRDHVFAELDADRRRRLAALTVGYEQVVVTAAVEEDIPEALHHHVVRISNGTISDERTAPGGKGEA